MSHRSFFLCRSEASNEPFMISQYTSHDCGPQREIMELLAFKAFQVFFCPMKPELKGPRDQTSEVYGKKKLGGRNRSLHPCSIRVFFWQKR